MPQSEIIKTANYFIEQRRIKGQKRKSMFTVHAHEQKTTRNKTIKIIK